MALSRASSPMIIWISSRGERGLGKLTGEGGGGEKVEGGWERERGGMAGRVGRRGGWKGGWEGGGDGREGGKEGGMAGRVGRRGGWKGGWEGESGEEWEGGREEILYCNYTNNKTNKQSPNLAQSLLRPNLNMRKDLNRGKDIHMQ